MLTFQQIIQRLTEFWEKQRCVIHQGHDLEVGAGTFNPATFLRCLGPEPYRTVYTEPSRRPKDGRYGDNPNRVQLFHQLQVIIKPSPFNIQQLYLDSLRAVGLKLEEHDIRFVHDDWEGPTLGAWGLGWEVWCDGMEVTQFTYFQAIGSLPLNPISVELTYGLERLAMYIQNVDSIFDVKWNEELTLRDIIHRNEVEWSIYNFDAAKTEMWQRHFDDFEKEALAMVERHLPIPAYDFVIKASHAFNILDARGAISVTERTGYIGRIRDLARLIAMEYLTSRENLGFPLLKKEASTPLISEEIKEEVFNPEKTKDFLLEIGSEELPSTFVPIGCLNLERAIRALLNTHELSFESIAVYGTPRRLAIFVKNLKEGTALKTIEKRGPAITAAFDEHGILTPQGAGFLKSSSIGSATLNEIQEGTIKNVEIRDSYIHVKISQQGQSTSKILREHLPKIILGLDFPKKMRWADLDISYARPLHWIVALFGEKVIPFHVGNVASGQTSCGHAQLFPEKILIKHPADYLSTLRESYVMADIEERKKSILEQLSSIEKEFQGHVLEKQKVLNLVLHLVEWPQLTHATFAAEFLKAPPEVLICEMVEHQKYFPLADANGNLKNIFIITADNTPNDLIRKGNQKVLSARLSDGVFLYNQDAKTPLKEFNKKLQIMTFQKDLGSMKDKVMRVLFVAESLNNSLKIAKKEYVVEAALFCKADLAAALVGEFPELQGTAGKYYALEQNLNVEVASAIEEHWMPRKEKGALPSTPPGIVLSLADKIDNLNSYFKVGLKPTSSSDPYALRRQAFGIIKILIENELLLDLRQFLSEEPLQFLTHRVKSVFEDEGFKKDEIEASLQGLCINPYDQYCKVKALHEFRKSGDAFSKLFEVYKRAKGQLEKPAVTSFDLAFAQEPAEKTLAEKLKSLEEPWNTALKTRQYAQAFSHIATLQPLIAHLFDTVKIMADDLQIRNNRIALLQKIFTLFEDLLDFSKIQA
ncbi:MAG: glycine--tRNA ligase subunit beta [Chlamydiota bacterium]